MFDGFFLFLLVVEQPRCLGFLGTLVSLYLNLRLLALADFLLVLFLVRAVGSTLLYADSFPGLKQSSPPESA